MTRRKRRRNCAPSGDRPGCSRGSAIQQSALASQKAAAAADAASKGLTAADPPAKPQTFGDIIAHLSPTSIIKAMAEGDVLQIVIFSVLFALAATAIGPKAKPVIAWCQSLADIMFRFTEYVMMFAADRRRCGDGVHDRA